MAPKELTSQLHNYIKISLHVPHCLFVVMETDADTETKSPNSSLCAPLLECSFENFMMIHGGNEQMQVHNFSVELQGELEASFVLCC